MPRIRSVAEGTREATVGDLVVVVAGGAGVL
jgi:hypothetical protein